MLPDSVDYFQTGYFGDGGAQTLSYTITGWRDTDNFNPCVIGSYTFTAITSLPDGYIFGDGVTPSVEIVVNSPGDGCADPSHTVTFDANGGTGTMSPQENTTGASASLAPNSFTRSGYYFMGWSTMSSGSINYEELGTFDFTHNVTLYAQWTALSNHTLTFHANGGSGSMDPQVSNDTTALNRNTFTRDGWFFAGWATYSDGAIILDDGAIYNFSFDVDLYAKWTVSPHTVTFDANGGTGTMADQSASTPTALRSNTFILAGYTFDGWITHNLISGTENYDDNEVYAFGIDATFIAQWRPNTYTVTYDSQGGSPVDPGSFTVDGYASSASAPEYRGHTFLGWYLAPTGGGEPRGPTGQSWLWDFTDDLTLYGHWSLNNHTVTYHGNENTAGSVPVDEASHDYNTSATVLGNTGTLVRTGYTFAGWNTQADGLGTSYSPDELLSVEDLDVILYAVWTPVLSGTHLVSFNVYGGTGSMVDQEFGVPTALATSTFTRSGYTFTGWATSAGGVVVYSDGSTYDFAADITLYAVWNINFYPVNYTASTGGYISGIPAQSVAYAMSASPVVALAHTGYHFLRWSDDARSATRNDGNIVSARSVMAIFEVDLVQYTITYSGSGETSGTLPSPAIFVVGGSAITLPAAGSLAKTGYSFAGWSLSPSGTALTSPYIPSGSGTVYALWTINHYTITASATGSGTITPSGATSFTFGAHQIYVFTPSAFHHIASLSVDGQVQAGAPAGYNFAAISGDHTVVVTFAADTFTVSYSLGDGSGIIGTVPRNQTLEVAAHFNLPNGSGLRYPDNTFIGWSDGTKSYVPSANFEMPGHDLVLTAVWKSNLFLCDIIFDGNGGTGSMDPIHNSTLKVTLPKTGFTLEGYNFGGWNTEANGSGISYAVGQKLVLTQDLKLNLFADWIPKVYKVYYYANKATSGSAPATQNYKVGTASLVVLPGSLSKIGFIFIGWNTVADGSGTEALVGTDLVPTANTNLYAQWLKSSETFFKAEFKSNLGQKKVQVNQIISLAQIIQLNMSKNIVKVEVLVNGVQIKVTVSSGNEIKLPVILGPGDVVEVRGTADTGQIFIVNLSIPNRFASIANVNFDLGLSKLTPAAIKILDAVVASVSKYGFTSIYLLGYTDSSGSGTFDNQKLSAQRAAAVAQYLGNALAKQNISIKTAAKAATSPVAPNNDPVGQALNRRVEIQVK